MCQGKDNLLKCLTEVKLKTVMLLFGGFPKPRSSRVGRLLITSCLRELLVVFQEEGGD